MCATHGLFSADAIQKLQHPNIREVVITDSIAQPEKLPDNFRILSVAPMLAQATQFIIEGGSIAALFKDRGI
ncbi:Ribose-phosphate pyrophosphokinase [compost metagenome]